MKKYFSISLLLVLMSNITFSQPTREDLLGNWIKFKAERKDGSKIIDRMGMDTAFLEYSFTPKEFSSQHYPFQKKEGFDYSIKKDRLYVGFLNEYQIEKVTPDTLILSVISRKEPDHKSNRYYFVRKNILSKQYPIQSKNNLPVYNKYNSPRVHKVFNKYLRTCNSGNTKNIRFNGFLVFDHNTKKISATLKFFSAVDEARKHTLKTCIENTYQYWDFAGVHKYSKAKIYFVARSFNHSDYIKFIFCTDDMSVVDNFNSINFKTLDQSKEYYLKGVSDLDNNLIDSAIANFTQSYQLDPVRLDALYKRAEAFLKKGDSKSACKDWNLLMSLDQKLAQKEYEKNCQ